MENENKNIVKEEPKVSSISPKTVVILSIVLCLIVGPLMFWLGAFFADKETNNNLNDNVNNTVIDNNDNYSGVEYFIYCNYEDTCYTRDEKKEEQSQFEYYNTYKCHSSKENCKVYDTIPNTNELLVFDNTEYYIYNLDNKKKTILNLNSKYNNIRFIADDNKIYGIQVGIESDEEPGMYSDGNLYALYDINKKEVISEYKYSGLHVANEKYIYGTYMILDDNVWHSYCDLLEAKSGKVVRTFEDGNTISPIKVGNKTLYSLWHWNMFISSDIAIYDSEFNKLIDVRNGYSINSNNTITTFDNDNNKYFIYNNEGNVLYTSKAYEGIYDIYKDYILVKDNGNLKLIDVHEEKVVADLLKLTDNYKVHPILSSSYEDQNTNESGIHIVVENEALEFGVIGSGLEYKYIINTGELKLTETEGVGGYM